MNKVTKSLWTFGGICMPSVASLPMKKSSLSSEVEALVSFEMSSKKYSPGNIWLTLNYKKFKLNTWKETNLPALRARYILSSKTQICKSGYHDLSFASELTRYFPIKSKRVRSTSKSKDNLQHSSLYTVKSKGSSSRSIGIFITASQSLTFNTNSSAGSWRIK